MSTNEFETIKDAPSVDIRNGLVASLFLVFGMVCCIFLFFVILIHLKYKKYRKNIFSILFACIIAEYFVSLHFLWTGFSSLVLGVENISTFVCDWNACALCFFINAIFLYNSAIIIMVLFDKMPYKKAGRVSLAYKKHLDKERKNTIFFWIHVCCILGSFLHTLFFIISDNYGEGNFGSCFVKKETNEWAYLLGIPFVIYLFLSLIYFILNLVNKYSVKIPCLKNHPTYSLLTTLALAIEFASFLIDTNEFYNSVAISGDLIALVIIVYFRISNGYIQTILKQGDSENKFVQAFLIFFCMETKADVQDYERRETIKLQALT